MGAVEPGRRPTMRDVARAAGVSQSLVSIVFRGVPGAGEQTRRRVLEAADRLGYVRDESARSLRAREATTLGVCFQARGPFHHELLDGLYVATADTTHHLVLSATSDDRGESEAIQDLLSYRCGALILLGSLLGDDELADLARTVPVVTVARRSEASEVDWVASDDAQGMQELLGHLKGLGHTDIAFLSCPEAAGGVDRLRAFEAAAGSQGLEACVRVLPGGMTEQAGAAVAEDLLAAGDLPTAVVGFNDRAALGVIDVFIRRGVRIPADVSVVGFDDSEIASRDPIRMTSVHQDPAGLARFAAERAIQRLSAAGPATQARGTLLPTSLVVRTTTGPARGR